MADSIPSLRRKLAEANARIAELEARPAVVVEKIVEVKSDPIRVGVPAPVYVKVEVPGPERPVYHDNPEHLETIRNLQEKLWQSTSLLASLSNQGQDAPLLLSAERSQQDQS